jgi:hypothetical protein
MSHGTGLFILSHTEGVWHVVEDREAEKALAQRLGSTRINA